MTDPQPSPPARRRIPKVPRPIRRALLLTGWVLATVVLSAEIIVSVRTLLS
ncbi:MAG: hypothetical protein O6952_08650 [Planctomycetota bacterium]|nr:hypothetical protein [Planctomycetota bacterium]